MLFALTACGTHGTEFEWDSVRQVEVGMTKDQVTSALGRPYRQSSRADGTGVWSRVAVDRLTFASKSASVIFKEGRVSSVPKLPEEFK